MYDRHGRHKEGPLLLDQPDTEDESHTQLLNSQTSSWTHECGPLLDVTGALLCTHRAPLTLLLEQLYLEVKRHMHS